MAQPKTTPVPLDAPRTLVLADNDELILTYFSECLQARGHVVHIAHDGLEALTLTRKVKPDALILDIVMPKLSGDLVCWLLRQDPRFRDLPIVAFSSLDPAALLYYPRLSADAYVAKGPLAPSLEHLLRGLASALSAPQLLENTGMQGYHTMRARTMVHELLREALHVRTLLEALGDTLIELDASGRILKLPLDTAEAFGTPLQEMVGQPLAGFCLPEDGRVLQDLLAELAATDRPSRCAVTLRTQGTALRVQVCPLNGSAVPSGFVLRVLTAGTPIPPQDAGPEQRPA